MRALVTGAAGFIGSTLVERLLDDGHEVTGIDCFTDFYSPDVKRVNLDVASRSPAFTLHEVDLRTAELGPLFEPADIVFHHAAQAGVRDSWSERFSEYTSNNVLATQRVLEAARIAGVGRVVYASSSSVYGAAEHHPTVESDALAPTTPYGVTKLAGEHLCAMYASELGVATVSLRYFSVYGPRQRPDMAIHRLVRAALHGEPFPLHGDGRQRRDFTFVGDAVEACVRAATADVKPGIVMNIAGGSSADLQTLVDLVERLTGSAVPVDRRPATPGDVRETSGDTSQARTILGWQPEHALDEGVAAQVEWHRRHGALS